jgi:hypothetical protein
MDKVVQSQQLSSRQQNILINRASPIPRSPQKKKLSTGAFANGAHHRVYRAPQASIRVGERKVLGMDKSGNTRRRRTGAPQDSISIGSLEVPYLWGDDDNELGNSHSEFGSASEDMRRNGSPRHHRLKVNGLLIQQGGTAEDYSDYLDVEESCAYTNAIYIPDESKKRRVFATSFNYQSAMQFIVLAVFGMMIYDSHHRVQKSKVQLQRYDEERAHILEQMMWIDRAAKKAHKSYAQKEIWANINSEDLVNETKDELQEEAQGLRDAVKKLQLRIQLNSRDRLEQRFGESPVHVSLSLDAGGKQQLVLSLSDDTPHAASILIEQIDKRMWDNIELQQMESGAIQISTRFPATTPVLEFIESSKSCHEAGSVVVRQLEAEAMDLNVLVLRIHMTDNHTPTKDEKEVCIGRVLSGFEYLEEADGHVPRIRDDRQY